MHLLGAVPIIIITTTTTNTIMHGIYAYTPATKNVCVEYTVAAIL